ncbi:hypothetical protein OK015_20375 [Mycobacterium sp. Aquia_216]|uniref:hypothetical protein n=1 Tax=Mycobacterium sp. Aquia_216 TaxID=2991729 RepID=UPI00227A11BA|nr:hypothetical protein [Mycobacterium sp. Aquia_216]WAJ43541.1 hypothetical protein OK015_20375 [Mycobacterium sp. Aquia_216]
MVVANSFLEHNSWLPGVVVAVVLFVIGAIQRHRDKQSKTFDYQIISDVPILRTRPSDLKVLYQDEELQHPRLLRAAFRNTGNQVIKEVEFLQHYSINFKDAKLADAQLDVEKPRGIVRHLIVDEKGQVEIFCRTINAGDGFVVQILLDSEGPSKVDVTGRIEGWSRPSKSVDLVNQFDLVRFLRMLSIPFIFALVIAVYFLSSKIFVADIGKSFGAVGSAIAISFSAAVTWVLALSDYYEKKFRWIP